MCFNLLRHIFVDCLSQGPQETAFWLKKCIMVCIKARLKDDRLGISSSKLTLIILGSWSVGRRWDDMQSGNSLASCQCLDRQVTAMVPNSYTQAGMKKNQGMKKRASVRREKPQNLTKKKTFKSQVSTTKICWCWKAEHHFEIVFSHRNLLERDSLLGQAVNP